MVYSVPERLLSNGRDMDSEFLPAELLFRRVGPRDIAADGCMIPSLIPFPNTSTNRGKYSNPEDVLEGREELLAYSMAISEMPPSCSTDGRSGTIIYSLLPIHSPEESNYSHTELRLFKDDGSPVGNNFNSRTAKKHFRLKLSLAFVSH